MKNYEPWGLAQKLLMRSTLTARRFAVTSRSSLHRLHARPVLPSAQDMARVKMHATRARGLRRFQTPQDGRVTSSWAGNTSSDAAAGQAPGASTGAHPENIVFLLPSSYARSPARLRELERIGLHPRPGQRLAVRVPFAMVLPFLPLEFAAMDVEAQRAALPGLLRAVANTVLRSLLTRALGQQAAAAAAAGSVTQTTGS
eukprot:Unigene3254_Nuclearia_a/m.9984 Unigene3254_Nuclearia_a/g.9984  ORF Unigene3254_Nuclearia_a/g.9984 Unigene3254_Nuclearia_a/m.9984 type:complete len:200 (+) Unigene3254_Nuclearia_a:74-673(+)